MSPEKKFDLGDYVEVKDRIKLFYELYGQGRLVTGEVTLTSEPDGVPRVMVQAFAYRSPDDGHPGVGHSWMVLPGTTSYTKGSELENVETSAWGRAIGSLGILIDRSIASAQEVANKQDDKPLTGVLLGASTIGRVPLRAFEQRGRRSSRRPADRATQESIANGEGSLIGTGEIAKDFLDFLPKQSPDGMVIGFKLVSPAGGIKVIARGDLAEVLPTIREDIIGKRVSCWGRVRDETFTPKGSKKEVTYQVLDLERIKTESGTLPMVEAPTAPLFEGPEFA